MWGPVETRRPGWTKEHQERMLREIHGHMHSLGLNDVEKFKEIATEVSAATDQIWRTAVRVMTKGG